MKTLSSLSLLVGAMLPVHSGLANAQTPRVIGCWQVRFDAWRPSPGGDSVLYQPMPTWIRLSDDTSGGYFLAVRRPNQPPRELARVDSLRARWKPLMRDSIEVWLPVWWSTGVRARMHIAGDSLRGDASIYVDFSPYETPHAQVAARRVSCAPAPNER